MQPANWQELEINTNYSAIGKATTLVKLWSTKERPCEKSPV